MSKESYGASIEELKRHKTLKTLDYYNEMFTVNILLDMNIYSENKGCNINT